MVIFRQVDLGMVVDVQEWVEECTRGLTVFARVPQGQTLENTRDGVQEGGVSAESRLNPVTGNVPLVLTGMEAAR